MASTCNHARGWMNSCSSIRGVGTFSRVAMCPPHMQLQSSTTNVHHAMSNAFHIMCICNTGTGVCLHLLVPPLAQHCFPNIVNPRRSNLQ